MKIMNQVTIRYLKENKKRTIFTLLCMTISVIMVSCVGIIFSSGKEFIKDFSIKTNGDYHYKITNNDSQIINIINNDNKISEYYFNSFDNLHDINNENINIWIDYGDAIYFSKNNYSKYIAEGRLPHNSQEIVLSKYFLKIIYHNKKSIGDTIQFCQWNEEGEEIKKSFQIVGILDSSKIGDQECNALSYIDIQNNDYFNMNIYIKDKEESYHIFEHVSEIENKYGKELNYEYNSSYLSSIGIFEENSQSSFINIYKVVAIMIFIIIFISYFIIYQAFHLSTYDRIQYLGMLTSVGATPKQKKCSVYFEGLLLSIIAIPLGIMISIVGVTIAFFFINQMEFFTELDIRLSCHVSFIYIGMIILLSLLTIMISLYKPARKISKISVIDALNKSDEIKVKKKKLKQNKFLMKVLNIDQQLALKNYKRQGSRARVIVFSLVASMIMFISVYNFGHLIFMETSQYQLQFPYEVICSVNLENQSMMNKYLQENKKIDDYIAYQEISIEAKINNQYFQNNLLETYQLQDNMLTINLVGVDQQTYRKICQDNQIKEQDNQVLLFNTPYYVEDNDLYVKEKFKKMDKNFIKYISYTDNDEQLKELPLFDDIQLIKIDNYDIDYQSWFYMIVPLKTTISLETDQEIVYKIQTQDHETVTNELNAMNLYAYDYAHFVQQNRQMAYTVSIFVYGFVSMMIFFAILNIMNIMSASIEKRRKEFGMMLSIGMSPHHIQKMIFYESFIYGIKTLIYGIPLSLLIEWILYIQIDSHSVFTPSWIAYLISFIVIMLVMLLTFRIGLQRFQKQNIIETLKDDI